MVCKKDLTKEYLDQCFEYFPDTGSLVWKERPPEHFKTLRGCNVFNKRYSGKEAGYISRDGYKNVELDTIAYRLHILIWILYYGHHPNTIDHENGIRDDNRIGNLRNVDRFENPKNAKRRKDNTSGVTGVSWLGRLNKWQVSINYNKNPVYIGVFSDIEDAIAARKEAEKQYGYHPNHGRD